MIKIGNKKVARIYLGNSKPSYFVGQMIPSMQKIDDPRFLLCDGSAHVWTDAQKAVLPSSITSSNVAPNMSGRTTSGWTSSVGTYAGATIPNHLHDGVVTVKGAYGSRMPSASKDYKLRYPSGSNVPAVQSFTPTYTTYYGEATGQTSKRTYVYWYLYIGED